MAARSALIAITTLVLLASCTCRDPVGRDPGAPDVVMVIVDTLRADHLGAWGYPHPTSPHLDALAARSVRFDQVYSASSWTRPGIATLLTGEYPRTLGLYEEAYDVLPDDVLTLPERLHARGYLTLGVNSNPNTNAWFGFDQGFDDYADSGMLFKFMAERRGNRRLSRKHRLETATSVTDRALDLVDRHRRELVQAPCYLQVLYIDPHLPRHPLPEDLAAMEAAGSSTPEYDALVRYVDREVERLLDGLAERGLMDDTLLVVTSDHGEGLDSHPRLARATTHGWYLYDSMLHIPLIVSHPSLQGGRVVPDLISSVDLAPTMLDLLGEPSHGSAGRSVVDLARGEEGARGRSHVFAETDWRVGSKVAVRTASDKLIRNPDAQAWQEHGIHEGRDLEPEERRYLDAVPGVEVYRAGAPEGHYRVGTQPEVAVTLGELLDDWERQTTRRPPLNRDPEDVLTVPGVGVTPAVPEATGVQLDPDLVEHLRALGYLDP